jgi:ankyrin repeat protein
MTLRTIYSLAILFFLTTCRAEGQTPTSSKVETKTVESSREVKEQVEIKVVEGRIVEIAGYDVSDYDLDLEYMNVEVGELTIDHVLCIAATECDVDMIKRVLDDGADPNAEIDGSHILTEIAFCEDSATAIAKMFLEKGANINGADSENDSFLSYAIAMDNQELIEYILKNGGSLDQRDTNEHMGCLPFHNIQSIEVLELLIKEGVDISQRCTNGRTLLHFCSKEGLPEVARYLLEHNLVDAGIEDDDGETAYDYAIRFRQTEVAKILK